MAEAERRIAQAKAEGWPVLDLGDLALAELSESLSELEQLRRLYLGKLGLDGDSEERYWFERSEATFEDLTPIAHLTGLQSLDLSWTGVSDVSSLGSLTGLQRLDLSGTGVSDVSSLGSLTGLESLSLFGTGVSDVSGLPAHLRSLSLVGCVIADLPPLFRLSDLELLDLEDVPGVSIAHLRSLADLPNLTFLEVHRVESVPREVLSRLSGDNCLARVRAYLEELDGQTEAEAEVKIILLGNGRVGKTQLCRRFRGEPFDPSIESTHGVELWRETLVLQSDGEDHAFQANWWDFGGQDIYHGTHALFLESRAVFLILWTPEHEDREEFLEGDLPLRNQPLAYWLEYVRRLAGKDSPVIVVQSQCDRMSDREVPRYPEGADQFGFFETCSYSAMKDSGREVLEGHLKDAIRYLQERDGSLLIGEGRAEVRRRLYARKAEDQRRKPHERQHQTLTPDEFRALCEDVGGIADWRHALDYMHQTGVVFYQPELFEDQIILDQTWALDAIYSVFDRKRVVPLLLDSGRFTRRRLEAVVWQERLVEEQELFLSMMRSCGICFPVEKTAEGETQYVAPDLLPGFESVASELPFPETTDGPTLKLEYDFFHQGIIRDLMAQADSPGTRYWKYGFWTQNKERTTRALVRFIDLSSETRPAAGVLEFAAEGRAPLLLIDELRRSLPWRWNRHHSRELLTLDGVTVAESALEHAHSGKVRDVAGRLVDSAPFKAFFTKRTERRSGALSKRLDHETAAIGTDDPEHSEPGKPRVFISYSHQDEDWKDRLVSHLGVLRDQLAVWDDRQIRGGDSWLPAIEEAMEAADVAVLLISKDFLTSDFIAGTEVPRLLEGRQEEGVRIIPVIVHPCAWPTVEWLSQIQARPTDGKPLAGLSDYEADLALTDLVTEIWSLSRQVV